MAIEETLAEKVLSFLRRRALLDTGNFQHDWDETLVRHIYDTFCIVQQKPASVESAKTKFAELVETEIIEHPKHHRFSRNPKETLSAALISIESDLQTSLAYQSKLLPLIYGKTKPDYLQAFQTFKKVSQTLLSTLNT